MQQENKMRYSRGNRGNPGRQWGTRDHQAPSTTKVKKVVRYGTEHTTTLRLSDPYFAGDPERLRWDVICTNCGARYHNTGISELRYCCHCDNRIQHNTINN